MFEIIFENWVNKVYFCFQVISIYIFDAYIIYSYGQDP